MTLEQEQQELYEVTIGGWHTAKQINWAVELFGDRVELHDSLPILYFRNRADVEFFMLKWG